MNNLQKTGLIDDVRCYGHFNYNYPKLPGTW